jgi:iron complex outermembrane receptor protein
MDLRLLLLKFYSPVSLAIGLLLACTLVSGSGVEVVAQSEEFSSSPWPTTVFASSPSTNSANLTATRNEVFSAPPAPADERGAGADVEEDLELDGEGMSDILNADIGQLSRTSVSAPSFDVEVSTVSRTESTVGKTPAAIFVITSDMIRRSGARSIPEVLRMAPGVHVAKINSSDWSVSMRGFGGRFTNKLLVQIDGRSVYTPLFGGVVWNVQNVMLEDVERIEVIRGPQATVWGANAVNGVINILTKSAEQTTGAVVSGGGGTYQKGFGEGRIGGQTAGGTFWRVYAMQFERDRGFSPTASDDWRTGQVGFRTDWSDDCDRITFQGDIYDGTAGTFLMLPNPPPTGGSQALARDALLRGGNVLARWTRTLGDDSDCSLQAYYDRRERDAFIGVECRDTFDLDFQHRFQFGSSQEILWGATYRNIQDRFIGDGFVIDFLPENRTFDVPALFVQDKVTLISDLLTMWAGVRVSHNDFTGVEAQPNIRMLWTPDESHAWWASVSRAVRTPTRVEDNLASLRVLPDLSGSQPVPVGTFGILTGNTNLVSEEVLAYELGYRAQPIREFSWDVALFYQDYEGIVNFEPTVNPLIIQIQNLTTGETYGVEVGADLEVLTGWNVRAAYTFLRVQTQSPPTALLSEFGEGVSPHNQVYLQSSWDIGNNMQFDLIGRYVDQLTNPTIPNYTTLDLRIGWYATDHLELSVVGRNLLDAEHFEFKSDEYTGVQATEIERSVYGMATWRY